MKTEDTPKQPQTSHHQANQPSQRGPDSGTTDPSKHNPSQSGENKSNPQDISKKNPTQGIGSPQPQGQDKPTQDKREKAS